MNTLVVIGNVVKENPVLKFTSGGKPYLNFSLSDSRKKPNSDTYDTQFFNCVAYGDLAMQIAETARQGTRLRVEGRVEVGKYTGKDNVERPTWSLILNNANPCFAKAEGDGGAVSNAPTAHVPDDTDPF